MTKFVGTTLRLPVLSAAPGVPVSGAMYYDSTLAKARFYDGTSWVSVPAAGGGNVPAGACVITDDPGAITATDTESENIAAAVETLLLEIATALGDTNTVPTHTDGDLELTLTDETVPVQGETSALDVTAITAETNFAPSDPPTFDLTDTEAETNPAPAEAFEATITFPDELNPTPAHTVGDLTVGQDETNPAPTETAGDLTITQADELNPAPTETATATITDLVGESSAVPTEVKTSTGYFYAGPPAAASTANNATNIPAPTNADGANNGTLAVMTTQALQPSTSVLTSSVTTNIPTGTPFSACNYVGFYKTLLQVATSNWSLVARSSSGLFPDINIVAGPSLANVDYTSRGSPAFDLFAAGVNTLAKARTLQIIYTGNDAAAGVTPMTMSVDASRIDIPNIV